jgi:hypothetical protein
MKQNLRMRLVGIIAAVCLVVPLLAFPSGAVLSVDGTVTTDSDVAIQNAINAAANAAAVEAGGPGYITVTGDTTLITLAINLPDGIVVNWEANMPNTELTINALGDYGFFSMSQGSLESLIIGNFTNTQSNFVQISESAYVGPINNTAGVNVYAGPANYDPLESTGTIIQPGNDNANELPTVLAASLAQEPSESEPAPTPPPEPGDEKELTGTQPGSPPGGFPGDLIIKVIDNNPIEKDGKRYFGTVDIENYFSDKPLEIPKEVFINGRRYLVGDTIYIVGQKDLQIIGYTETGVSYVFPVVENTDDPVKFTAEDLPEGVVLSEDGVLSTESLPLVAGTYKIMVTADNGKDTHTIPVTIIIKEGYASDAELLGDLTLHDKEDEPEVLDDNETADEENGILNLWINGELKLHYDPELEDFAGLFLDGKLLQEGKDYTTEEGSTVVVLTEQTMIPLTNGDHVVTTLFNQNSDVGMDTVINDVGSSSFVFRFGEKGSTGTRVNISGDGVKGSVTFDDSTQKQPITTLSANTEAIQTRCANLSNATGNEIIAAFETKQSGGFGGKTATFAIDARSLGLTLKNGSAVYIAVYDSKTGKTYQNQGEVKDGVIIFKTKYSGVFMISREKY